jgi:hypothetical protein
MLAMDISDADAQCSPWARRGRADMALIDGAAVRKRGHHRHNGGAHDP